MRAWSITTLAGLVLAGAAALGAQPRPVEAPRRGLPAFTDTLRMPAGRPITFQRIYQQVAANHPVARQARLIEEGAQGDLTAAWGNFEPKFSATWETKRFGSSNTLYYSYADVGVKIPTPIGADFKVGYERAAGSFINPQLTTPLQGLVYAGFSLPLGQRIITDERRNALRVARALRDVAAAERQGLVNKLLFSAAKSYANWYEAALRLSVQQEGVRLAEQRYRALVGRVIAGDAAGIDSIEADAERIRRLASLVGAEQDYFAAARDLESFLWDARGNPEDLPFDAAPSDSGLGREVLDSAAVPRLLAQALRLHPDIRKADGKAEQAEADRLLAVQQIFPLVSADVAALATRGNDFTFGPSFRREQEYKASLSAETPLLFFKERGKFRSTDAKFDRARIDQAVARRDVGLLFRTAINDLAQFERQLDLQARAVQLFGILSVGERARFELGESTLFLVNARERSLLDEQAKLVALRSKYFAARAALAVAAGQPGRLSAAP